MGDFLNHIIDNLVSVTWRLMELPLYILIGLIFLCLLTANLAIRKSKLKVSGKALLFIYGFILLLLVGFIIDKKFSNIRAELTLLNEKVTNTQIGTKGIVYAASNYDLSDFTECFPGSKVYHSNVNEAVSLFLIRKKDPNVVAYIGVIDLEHPRIKIQITPEKKHKYLTSVFAEEHNCIIAINGEAGESMAMDCNLGEWTGNWVVNGKPVLMEDSDKRPFIMFSKNNVAAYSKASVVDVTYSEEKFNAIWGRHDILVADSIPETNESRPYARTIMGVNKEGNKLFLMVVDGKRPDYSIGLSYADCAEILKWFGTYSAMACDQGGSSCMYVSTMGGIINRPADSDGSERPIYTHFGVSF